MYFMMVSHNFCHNMYINNNMSKSKYTQNIQKSTKGTHQICAGHRQWQIALIFGPILVDPVEIDVQLELDAASGTSIIAHTFPVR